MKVLPFKISKSENVAIVYQEYKEEFFYGRLHQHEEIQLSLILSGEGTLVIGDSMNKFKSDDVLAIGSNLPHVFKSDGDEQAKSHMISIFFGKNSFGRDFFESNEFTALKLFFKQSAYGLRITSNLDALKHLFIKFNKASKLNRFIILFEILQLVSKSKTEQLSSFVYKGSYSDDQGKRMSDVFEHTMHNFHDTISLDEIANVANMTPQSFCKYFKQRTNKTYFGFLNELRIEHACKLLLASNDLSISEISLKSGFNNISNFNRRFRLLKKTTPLKYRSKHEHS